jgi:hypothetical protein
MDGQADRLDPPYGAHHQSLPGDLWIIGDLGNHRLLCGDSTDVLAVERLMDGSGTFGIQKTKAPTQKDMVPWADPPHHLTWWIWQHTDCLREKPSPATAA